MNLLYNLPDELVYKIFYELHKLNYNNTLNSIDNFKNLWEEIDGSDGYSNLDTNPIEIYKYYHISDKEWLICKKEWINIDKSNEKNIICFPKVLLRILEAEEYYYICDLTKCIKCNDCINSHILHYYRHELLSENGYICDECPLEDTEEDTDSDLVDEDSFD